MKEKGDQRKPAAKKGKQVEDAKEDLELSDEAAQKVKGGVQKVRELGYLK